MTLTPIYRAIDSLDDYHIARSLFDLIDAYEKAERAADAIQAAKIKLNHPHIRNILAALAAKYE